MNREQEIKSIKESQLKLADEQRKLADRLEALEKPEAVYVAYPQCGEVWEDTDGSLYFVDDEGFSRINSTQYTSPTRMIGKLAGESRGSKRLGTFDEVFVRRAESMTRDEVEAEFVPKYMVSLVLESAELAPSLGCSSRKTIEYIRKHLL